MRTALARWTAGLLIGLAAACGGGKPGADDPDDASRRDVVALTGRIEPSPRPPAQFATLRRVAGVQGAALSTQPVSPAYDRTFIAFQVENHTAALDSLRRWRQAARDPGLRAALATALPKVEAHLERAKQLQAALAGPDSLKVAPPPPDTGWIQRLKQANVPAAAVTADTMPNPATKVPGNLVPFAQRDTTKADTTATP
jgi:hypothetical protein